MNEISNHPTARLSEKLYCGGGRGQGVGALENRGRERYGRRERKGREAGVHRWRDAGVKCKTLLVDI